MDAILWQPVAVLLILDSRYHNGTTQVRLRIIVTLLIQSDNQMNFVFDQKVVILGKQIRTAWFKDQNFSLSSDTSRPGKTSLNVSTVETPHITQQ